MAGAGAVIVVQGKMYGIDTNAVGLGVPDGVALVDLVAGAYAQFVLKRVEEGTEQIENQSVAAMQQCAVVVVDESGKNHRFLAIFYGRSVDASNGFPGLFIRLDKGQGDLHKLNVTELAEHAVAKGFCGDAGAIGEIECRSFHWFQPFSVPVGAVLEPGNAADKRRLKPFAAQAPLLRGL